MKKRKKPTKKKKSPKKRKRGKTAEEREVKEDEKEQGELHVLTLAEVPPGRWVASWCEYDDGTAGVELGKVRPVFTKHFVPTFFFLLGYRT